MKSSSELFKLLPVEPIGYSKLDARRKHGLRCSIIAKRSLLAAYGPGDIKDNGLETTIADLLCDFRHLCDRLRLDFDELDAIGWGYYSEERGEDEE